MHMHIAAMPMIITNYIKSYKVRNLYDKEEEEISFGFSDSVKEYSKSREFCSKCSQISNTHQYHTSRWNSYIVPEHIGRTS